MPMLDRFAKEQGASGVQVLAIAADRMEPVKKFLKQNELTLPVAVGGADVLQLGRLCGNLSGSLPFSILFDAHQNVVQRKLGKLNAEDLVVWGQKT
jgi:thiol-disulfide isomerase/thioredoxin